MPIYEYTAVETGCVYCESHFEQLEKIKDIPLQYCPKCNSAVRRVICAVTVVAGQNQRLKESHLEKHGFTQYRRAGKGVYEKTTGKGPKFISGD